MLGKLIILAFALVAVLGLLNKFAARLGLIKFKPQSPIKVKTIGKSGFQLTKFNLVMMSLAGLYIVWGVTQLFR